MSFFPTEMNDIDRFKRLVSDEQYNVKEVLVCFGGATHDGVDCVHSARVFLQNAPSSHREFYVQSESIFAGKYVLAGGKEELTNFIDNCLAGQFPTPNGMKSFDGRSGRNSAPNIYLDPAFPENDFQRIFILRLTGQYVQNPRTVHGIDWELRAATTPFVTFDDLSREILLENMFGETPTIEFVAFQSAVILKSDCWMRNGRAFVAVRLAHGLNSEQFALGVIQSSSGPVNRYSIEGSVFNWQRDELGVRGTFELDVGQHDTLQLFCNYNGFNYGREWLFDQSSSPNTRFVSFKAFDPTLERTRDNLFGPDNPKRRSEDFEVSVTWLFWLLGFNPIALDLSRGLPEAPDLLVSDERGNIVLIECAVGRIDEKQKLEKLAKRADAVRSELSKNGLGFVSVFAIVATRSTADHLATEIKTADELGIFIADGNRLKLLLEQADRPLLPSAYLEQLRNRD